jgi:pyridoxal phosphate enzyme (YggS family)
MTLQQRLSSVQGQVAAATLAAGRPAGTVQLIAVSKLIPVGQIQVALDAGQVDFGENYAAEMAEKQTLVVGPARWHFIGRIQKNKAKKIASAFRVHTVTSVEEAVALTRYASSVAGLVAVHTGTEETKSGVEPERALALVRELAGVPGFKTMGLMTLPPPVEEPEEALPYFRALAQLLADCQADGHDMRELSMGMSHDFEVAIAAGATWVRVGTAIFGPRPARI